MQGTGGVPFKVAYRNGVAALNDGGLVATVGQLAAIGASSDGYEALGVAQPDPVSAQALSGPGDGPGDVLVADATDRLVAEFSPSGSLVWSYTSADDPSLSSPVSACSLSSNSVDASGHIGDGYVLICDRGADRVFIVRAQTGQVVWQYGTTGESGSGVDQLDSPASAEWLANGNASSSIADDGDVAICDAGNHRVIIVRAGDFTGVGPDAGFTASSITWQYGSSGAAGSGIDQLDSPTSVQRLGQSQDMLICDQSAARVIEVRYGDYDASAPNDGFSAASTVWQFSRSGAYALSSPTCALGSGGGVIWIADAGHVYGVATGTNDPPTGQEVFADYFSGMPGSTEPSLTAPGSTLTAPGSLVAPASLSQVALGDTDGGSLVIADPGAHRVVTLGTVGAGSVRLAASDLGHAGAKRLSSLSCTLAQVPGSVVTVSYSVDGGRLKTLGTYSVNTSAVSGPVSKTIAFPPLTIGKKVVYYLSFSAAGAAVAPDVLSLATIYKPWTAKASGKGGGGASGERRNSNGSASGRGGSAGGGSGSGGGVGGGTGSGSGQGVGRGRGSGSTDSNGADTGAAGNSTGAALPAAVAGSTASGDAASRTVSGYEFRVAGRAGGGEGGGSSPAGMGLPLLPALGGLAGVALLLVVGPWAARRRLHLFTGWDEHVPRPFPADRTTEMPRRFSLPRPLGRYSGLPK